MMQWDYLYDESEKTLAPFFSKSILSYHFRCIIIAGLVLLVLWPRQPFYHFLVASNAPLIFFQVFVAATILCSYLSLRCGKGEMVLRDYFSEYYEELPCYEKERNFFTYGLVGFLLHTTILVVPFIPILIIATAVSWVPFALFAKAVIVLYASALLCRTTGFVLYLIGGRLSYSGYFIARVFIIFYLFATALFYSRINPLHILYRLNKGVKPAQSSLDSAFGYYMAATGIALCILIFISHVLILRYNNRLKEA
jgi:hypothetical protein